MKFLKSLPARLLLAIAFGILAGLVLPEGAMKVIVTVKYILGQMISFCVPLIIIGFIAPSVTQMGSGATKMLTVAIAAAYLSSLFAAFLSAGAGFATLSPCVFSDAPPQPETPSTAASITAVTTWICLFLIYNSLLKLMPVKRRFPAKCIFKLYPFFVCFPRKQNRLPH